MIPADQGDRRRVAQMIDAARKPPHRGRPRPRRLHGVRRLLPGRDATSSGSISRTATTPSICSCRRSSPTDTPYEPYDDVSWALPVHYGVEAKAIADEKIKNMRARSSDRGAGAGARPGRRVRSSCLRDTGQEAMLAARVRLASFRIDDRRAAFQVGGGGLSGRLLDSSRAGRRRGCARSSRARAVARLRERAERRRMFLRHEAPLPRSPSGTPGPIPSRSAGCGCTLDREKIPYAYIRDDEIRAGKLREKYDVILFGNNYLESPGADPRHRQALGTDALHEDRAVPEPRRSRLVGRHHGRNRMERRGEPRAVPGRGRDARHAGQRVCAAARGRTRAGRLSHRRQRFDARRRSCASRSPSPTTRSPTATRRRPRRFDRHTRVYDVRRSDRGRIVLQWGTKLRKDDRDEDEAKSDAQSSKPDQEGSEQEGGDRPGRERRREERR